MSTDRIEALIREIAARHGIAVGRDDPILILHTLNERLLQDSAEAQQAQLEEFKQALEAVAQRWTEEARGKAERTLNAALTASRETMQQAFQQTARVTAECQRQAASAASARLEASIRDARRVACLNLAAAALTALAAGLVLWVGG